MHPDVWDETQKALADLDYPARKDEIVTPAAQRSGTEEVVRLLRALPLATYRNLDEVRRSVWLDPAAPEGRTPGQPADQKRSQHSHQIAEHLRNTEQPPVRRRGGV